MVGSSLYVGNRARGWVCMLKFGGGCRILNRMVNAEEEVIQRLYSFIEYRARNSR